MTVGCFRFCLIYIHQLLTSLATASTNLLAWSVGLIHCVLGLDPLSVFLLGPFPL